MLNEVKHPYGESINRTLTRGRDCRLLKFRGILRFTQNDKGNGFVCRRIEAPQNRENTLT